MILVGTCDLRTLWSPPVSLNQETHTQRCKAANFIFILFIFGEENPLKSPPWKHTWWSEHFGKFPKKKLNRHISRRGKKRVLKSPHIEEKKNRFWNRWDLCRIWADSKLSSFETRLWRSPHFSSGYPWPSETMKSPRSEWAGASKKRQNYQIYLVGFECVVKDIEAWLQLFTSFIATFGTIFLRKVSTFFYGRSPLWL